MTSVQPSEPGPGDVLRGEIQVEPPSVVSAVRVHIVAAIAIARTAGEEDTHGLSSYDGVTRPKENGVGVFFSEKAQNQPIAESIGGRSRGGGADLGIPKGKLLVSENHQG